jgi:hypothetical protein
VQARLRERFNSKAKWDRMTTAITGECRTQRRGQKKNFDVTTRKKCGILEDLEGEGN